MNDAHEYDPRPAYDAAVTWVAALMDGVQAEQLDQPTPCTDFDVRTLMGHLIATGVRAEAIGLGRDPNLEPRLVETSDPAAEYRAITDRARQAWSDDAALDAASIVPWGTVPGRAALTGYVNETLTHAWDLAVATGQPAETDVTVAEPALVAARSYISAEIRASDDVPFGPVVQPREGAGPVEQLANWCGRSSVGWV